MSGFNMRKICVFIENWMSGGIESFLRNTLLNMNLNQFEVHIIAEQVSSSVFTEDLKRAGVRFIELSGNSRCFSENIRLFKELLKENQYDVLHVNAFQAMTLYYGEVARKAGIPVRIAHSHNTALRKSASKNIKLAIHRFYRRRYTKSFTQLWACSRMAAEFLFDANDLQNNGFRFIPNGIQIEQFKPNDADRAKIRDSLGLENALLIGSVGRLCGQKNQTFLVELMPKIIKVNPVAILLLVGEGPDKDALAKTAQRLNVADHVIFYGATSHVEQIYSAIDVLAFPSTFEGLPIVAVEAQAAGLPVICSDLIPEETFITPQAKCIPLSDREGWVRALTAGDLTRKDYSDTLTHGGFAIQDVAKAVEQSYLEGIHGE